MKMQRKKEILFLCTGNSCRSQMAEGLARHLISDHAIVYSAGVETHGINKYAAQVMQEIGIDIKSHKSQHINEFTNHKFDFVIIVCDKAAQSCPTFTGATTIIKKPFNDPPALVKNETDNQKILLQYRIVRDEIQDYIKTLPKLLNP